MIRRMRIAEEEKKEEEVNNKLFNEDVKEPGEKAAENRVINFEWRVDLIDKKIEKFEKEEKTVETMVEMLDFVEENKLIEEDQIKEVVKTMLDLERVAKLLNEGLIEAWKQKLEKAFWEGAFGDMKIEAKNSRDF